MSARILVVDDHPTNLKLACDVLENAGFQVERARDAEEALAALQRQAPDLILLDVALPGMDGLTLTRKLKSDEATRAIRIVAMTAYAMKGDEEKARAAGCDGYITKPIDTRKLPDQVRQYLEGAPDGPRLILIVDDIETNRKLLKATLQTRGLTVFEAADGFEALHILEREPVDAIISDVLMPNMDGYRLCFEVRQSERFHDLPFIFYTNTYTSPSDEIVALAMGADKFLCKPAPLSVIVEALQEVTRTVTHHQPVQMPLELDLMKSYSERLISKLEEKNADLAARTEALEQAEAKYRNIFETAVDGIIQTTLEGRILTANPAAASIFGYDSPEELLRAVPDIEKGYVQPERRAECKRLLEGQDVVRGFEFEYCRKDGVRVWISANVRAVRDAGRSLLYYESILEDITGRKSLQEQLLQAQKMEVVGRLAGGVAHDFNNLLTVIMGFGNLMEDKLPANHGLRGDLAEIRKAAERAASLTRQLLAFSRRQVVQPQVLDLNRLVADAERMLYRVLGEDVELVTLPGSGLGRVRADPSQVEQVILNLAVNARDALPRGGKVTIETANADLEENRGVPPGSYVTLRVSDTGSGMTPEVLAHLFEPFFTTKGPGRGTGLGLATVYGIVTQSGGEIRVESAPGQGSSFTVYFPRTTEAAPAVAPAARGAPQQGSETILLVEDSEAVRKLVRQMLSAQGYTVLEAAKPHDALSFCREHPNSIDLLLTDLVMPEMYGPDLAAQVTSLRPGIRVLYMSGYASETVAPQGVSRLGAAFLEKPFTPQDLARKVREVLEG